jgi:hypothetical protein
MESASRDPIAGFKPQKQTPNLGKVRRLNGIKSIFWIVYCGI